MMSNRTHRELIDDGEPALRNKVAFLSRPQSYPGAPEVEVKETRMSWVFLAGNRVYKFKKPVRYPYLDYSTRERRREICETEVRLNRRLAPDIYLGVGRLTMKGDGTLAILHQFDADHQAFLSNFSDVRMSGNFLQSFRK